VTEFGPIIAWVEQTDDGELREHRVEPWRSEPARPEREFHFLSNYYIPEPKPKPEPRPEQKRIVCPACLRKIAVLSDGRLARHGLTATACPAFDVWKWTEEGPPRPVTGEARAWLPALRLMAAGAWEDRQEQLREVVAWNEDSTGSWDVVADALRSWRVAERNRWARGIPYDFCPEERE